MHENNDFFTVSFPITLTFDPLISYLLPPVTRMHVHISTKFEVSTAFSFPVNRRHRRDRPCRQTDGRCATH